MNWDVEYTDEFAAWWAGLTRGQRSRIAVGVELLQEHGPALGRPYVDTIKGSMIPNLKELRASVTPEDALRVLFVFDPRRVAILLLGGDKRGDWNDWYKRAIPEAERIYEVYVAQLREEGLL